MNYPGGERYVQKIVEQMSEEFVVKLRPGKAFAWSAFPDNVTRFRF